MLPARPLRGQEATTYAAVRLHAVHHLMPYLAAAAFRLQPFAVEGLGTFGVDDRWRVYVDPEVLLGWPVPQAAGVLLHEVGHALRDHAGQARQLGPQLDRWAWNLCGDAAINDDLVAAGVQLPGTPVLPEQLHDRQGRPLRVGGTAAAYYAQLPVAEVDVDHTDLAARAPGTAPDDDASVVPGRSGRADAGCGGVSGGAPLPVTAPDDGAGHDGVGVTEQRLARRAVAAAISAHAGGAGRGEVPAGLRRWADAELAPPTVDWRQQLRGAVRRAAAHAAGALDTTYARPSRRRVPGVVLPGTRRPVPAVAVVVDTSGSMGRDRLTAALGEVEGVARQVGASGQRLRVLAVDAAVHEVRSVQRAAEVVLRGGGGTDLTPGLEAAVAARPAPDVVVVLTDGWTPWPTTPPGRGARWIVVLLDADAHGATPAVPDWAEVVTVPIASAVS